MNEQSDFPTDLLAYGCGNMAGSILKGWISAGADPAAFTAFDPHPGGVPDGVKHVASPPTEPFDIVLLGVKPQMLGDLAGDIAKTIKPGTIIISILAGIEIATLDRLFPDAKNVRLMPNLGVALRKSPLGLYSAALSDGERAALTRWMDATGAAEWIDKESDMDLVAALAGSGPAYVYRFTDALATAATRLGLPEDQAARMALATVEGAAALAVQADDDPGVLADRVASPGGSTREGMNVLDADERLVKLLTDVLEAARDRNGELARLFDA
ncbi:pyrroline-5-carboxylate reductase family protein [Novosphingopyxis baekryungensis]|uniref:pyrroline-5-carboxylate reductase family protein n=1 Tax=Novosphingopyxis baekryungensis TaxID=279369 RepID=UPI0004905F45|nr:pyrroline-5-carboxylate reductase [Novosphingopyxis baekryungensis]